MRRIHARGLTQPEAGSQQSQTTTTRIHIIEMTKTEYVTRREAQAEET